ncbi:MAG TPA: PKD domain-containing protein [Candidatus Saccharimonadales bacterium]
MYQSIKKRLARINPKQLVVVAGFMLAMAGAVGLGLATKQLTFAASGRDTGTNPILNQGSIGCLSMSECISDIRANNPSDVQTIYADRGLTPDEYDRFTQTARLGKIYRNGNIVVDNQVVATGAWSMGREKFNWQRQSIVIGGKTYYMSSTQTGFASDSLDAYIMFADNGTIEFAMLTACGNPAWGNNITPEYGCKMLNKTAVAGQENTYNFSTTLDGMKLATMSKIVYDFGDGSEQVVSTNAADTVKHTYTKVGNFTAKVTVYFNLPGGKTGTSANASCTSKVTVPPPPFYTCDAVTASALNDNKTKFRFVVKTSQGNGAVAESADFTLDNSSTAAGITAKDANGNYYNDYEFARDGKDHTVVVKANFNLAKGITSVKCRATVTAGKTPMCTVPGKEQYPADSPLCKGDTPPVVTTTTELPKTGMGSTIGIFVVTTIFAAAAHRLFMSRRNRFQTEA